MLFNSYVFLFAFLPITLSGFYILYATGRRQALVPFLFLASVAFYAWWTPADSVFLISSIVGNFLISGYIARSQEPLSKRLLTLAVCANLGLLFYFKYYEFVMSNVAAIGGWPHTPTGVHLPIGISFFTFTQLAYLVDCYRSRDSERTFSNYGLFVTIFPHLIAGPIIHHAQMRPQFDRLRTNDIDPTLIAVGVMCFIMGLAKKVLLADNLVTWADPAFNAVDTGGTLSSGQAWIGILAYTLQIYFDFSGYSDMAIGLALLFGIRLPINFDSPYKSRSFIEFWRRWHITLSTWLRDYLYIPLGGNRGGEFMRLRNVMITMVLGGIWHGAGWTFLIWGAIHGTCIVINHLFRSFFPRGRDQRDAPLWDLTKLLTTLLLVMVAWVFFRATTTGGAMSMLQSMFTGGAVNAAVPHLNLPGAFWILLAGGLALLAPNTQQILRYSADPDRPLRLPAIWSRLANRPSRAALFGVLLAAAVACIWRPAIFIYFNF